MYYISSLGRDKNRQTVVEVMSCCFALKIDGERFIQRFLCFSLSGGWNGPVLWTKE